MSYETIQLEMRGAVCVLTLNRPDRLNALNVQVAKDFKAAVGHLTKAVQEEPKNADAQSMLGYSYRKLGTFDKSMEHYQTALKIDSNHRSAHEYLGELYLDMNQPDNADKQLAALKKACPMFGKCEEYEDLKKEIDAYKAKKK